MLTTDDRKLTTDEIEKQRSAPIASFYFEPVIRSQWPVISCIAFLNTQMKSDVSGAFGFALRMRCAACRQIALLITPEQIVVLP
ncbi:MAG TPA: hypothetical protein VG324_14925 [Blastocatellia bacterium]|nr:hypothetical protein [Blastocatellia bacterium]